MPIPYTREEIRAATLELIARNGLRSCYIRPLVFRGYGHDGPVSRSTRPVDVAIAVWEWGAYLGEEGKRNGIRAKVSSWRRISPDSLIPHAKAVGPVPQQRAREDRDAQGRLRGGDPARRPRPRLRGLGREHLRRARRRDRHAAADRVDPRRHQPRSRSIQIARDLGYEVVERDIARAELYLADEVFMTGTAAELVPGARDRRPRDRRRASPARSRARVQTAFDDALHGRAERYREWLDAGAGRAPAPSARERGRRALRRHPPRRHGRRRACR